MNRAFAVAAVAILLAAPTIAQEPEDTGLCLDAEAGAEDRIAACTRLIDAGVDDEDEPGAFHLARAERHYFAGRYDEAVTDADAAIALNPENGGAHSIRGQSLMFMERYEDARLALEEAVRLNPESAWEYAQLGHVLGYLGEYELALTVLDQSLALNRESWAVYHYRGDANWRAGNIDAALADYTAGLEVAPFSSLLHLNRGRIHRESGDMASALHDYRIAFLLNPNRVSEGFLQDQWPPRPIPEDLEPIVWEPPIAGMRVSYVEINSVEQPYVDPMEAAIMAIAAWFSSPEVPLPYDREFITLEVGESEGYLTEYGLVDPDADAEPDGDAGEDLNRYAFAMLPATQVVADVFPVERVWPDPGSVLFPLEPGREAEGTGSLLLTCSAVPAPARIIAGCRPGMEVAEVGTFDWRVTVHGWEDVLVPAGRRLAMRVTYEEVSTVPILTDGPLTQFFATWWYDPKINRWVKRDVVQRLGDNELGIVVTREATAFEMP